MALTRAKRLKLQHEAELAKIPKFDPFEVISEPLLKDLIFLHLSGSDVKNLFGVCKKWNQEASDSRVAMSKIKLNVVETDLVPFTKVSRQDLNLLLNSNRRYQKAILRFIYRVNIDWKLLLLKRFSLSLVDLKYYDYVNASVCSDLVFPKLQRLETMSNIKSAVGIVQGAPALKQLILFDEIDQSSTMLMNSISSLESLKILRCNEEVFELALTRFPALKTLHAGFFEKSEMPKVQNQSITYFGCFFDLPANIISCMENLEVFYCLKGGATKLRMILAEGKKLKKVIFNYWADENTSPLEIYENLKRLDPTIPLDVVIKVGLNLNLGV